jgi:hypothetical protein
MKSIFDDKKLKRKLIQTVVITPKKEMPLDVFKSLHHIAYFMEFMERVSANQVIWDETVSSIYSEQAAEAEYYALQNDWFVMPMELPVKLVNKLMSEPSVDSVISVAEVKNES